MAEITLHGNAIHTIGSLPVPGSQAPDFTLTKTDLLDVSLADYSGKRIIMNIFPSLDTPVCALSIRKFNQEAEKLVNAVVLTISRDLPFAHERFCSLEGIKNVVPLSEMRNHKFGKDYGVRIVDGSLEGLLSRAVVVVDEKGVIVYTQQVKEISEEPNYEAAIGVLV